MYVCTYVCMHVCMHACMHGCMYMSMYMYTYMYMHMYMYTYTDTYMYMYMYMWPILEKSFHRGNNLLYVFAPRLNLGFLYTNSFNSPLPTRFSKAQPNPHVVETGGQLRCEVGGLRKAPTQHGIEVLGALIALVGSFILFIHLGSHISVDAYGCWLYLPVSKLCVKKKQTPCDIYIYTCL